MTVNHGYKSDICWEESIVHRKKIIWTFVFIQYIYFCMNVLHVKWNLACPITVHSICYHKYKITSMKKNILGGHPVALVGQAKDFQQHHIWCFPLPCTGEKSPWMPHTSPAMIRCDVLTYSIHGINRDIWSCALHIWSTYKCSQTWLVKWLIQIVLQL